MSTLKKIGRALIILIAVLVIVLSAAGIYGAWYVNRTVTDMTLKVFSVVDIGVAVAETGVTRVDTLVQGGRTEVQQAEQTIENRRKQPAGKQPRADCAQQSSGDSPGAHGGPNPNDTCTRAR